MPMEIIAINPVHKKRRTIKRRAIKRGAAGRIIGEMKKQKAPARRPARTIKRKAKTKRTKKGIFTMANPIRKTSRRTKRRTAPRAAKTVYRYRTRGRGRKMARSAGAFAKSTFLGLNVTGAIKNALPLLFGALVGKAAAKKLADSGGEGENWTWKNYALCMGGGAAGALLIEAVFKRRGLGQKVLEGATLLTLFKIWTNEIAPKNATLQAWFGGADEDFGQADPYAGLMAQADPYAGLFGAVMEEPEGDYSQDDMAYYGTPVLPAGGRMGGDVRDAGGRMGGLGAEESRAVTEMFNRAYR